jgi:hypothetical protein
VGSDVVVVVHAVTHSLLHLCKGEEEIHVEARISELAVEALNVAIFTGFSGSDEVELWVGKSIVFGK